jgi:hypothetical protein
MRIYTNKDKAKVLRHAKRKRQVSISLWKDPEGKWHAAHGPNNVPDWAVEVEHIQ